MIYWKHGFFMMAAIAVLLALAWWAQWEITDDYRTDNERLRDHISRRNSEDIGCENLRAADGATFKQVGYGVACQLCDGTGIDKYINEDGEYMPPQEDE